MIGYKHHHLFFAGLDVADIARTYPTPFFLFSEKILKLNYDNFIQEFKKYYGFVRVDYSVKTNNEIAILKILCRAGAGAEVSCGHDLYLSLKAGINPGKIVFDGPCKTDSDLNFAVKTGIHAFYADSYEDLLRIDNAARKHKKKVKTAFRVNPGNHSFIAGPAEMYIAKFGIPAADIPSLTNKTKKLKHLQLIGLTTHLGSQILSPKPYRKALAKLISVAKSMEETGTQIKEINLGGGFPSQTLSKTTLPSMVLSNFGLNIRNKASPLADFGRSIASDFKKEVRILKSRPVLALQPGRCLVSGMGIAVSRIKVVKKNWLFLDISTSSLPESLFFAQREILLVENKKRGEQIRYNIAGCGLNSADNFAIGVNISKPKVDDYAAILDAGAYSISRANRFTVLNPPVYLVTGSGKIKMIRRAETYEDISSPMQQ